MKRLTFTFATFIMSACLAAAVKLPEKAVKFIPLLLNHVYEVNPNEPMPTYYPALVEQETCAGLKSKGCWNERSELKTSREWGLGLAQMTIAYNPDHSVKFSTYQEVAKYDKQLKEWKDYYDPNMQLRALVFKTAVNLKAIKNTASINDHYQMADAAYNGGLGGLNKDRLICQKTTFADGRKCDTSKWFNNVALTSYKSKTSVSGYSKSFYQINREHVSNIWNIRMNHYTDIVYNWLLENRATK